MLNIYKLDRLNTEIIEFIAENFKNSGIPKINIDPQFLLSYDKHIRKSWKPLFIVVERETETIGIIPLMYSNDLRKGFVSYRRLKFFAADFSDFQDIYAKKENRSLVLREGFKWLLSKDFRWEEMILDDLLDATGIIEPLQEILKEKKLSHTIHAGKYYYIDLDQSWEEVTKNFSKSFVHRNYKNAVNRITKAGNWEIEFDPEITAQEIMTRAAPIHVKRQNVLDRPSRFNSPSDLKCYEEIISLYLKKDSFKTFWIKIENEYIGYLFGFYLNKIFYAWSMAFDPDHDYFSPIRILQYDAIEFLHQQGCREFNFMRGESGYKDKWTKTTRNNYRFRIYNNKSMYGKMLGVVDKNFKPANV